MTKEEQAVIQAAEAIAAGWAAQTLAPGAGRSIVDAVAALHASRGVYPTETGRWWAQSKDGQSARSLFVVQENGVFIVDPGGRPVTDFIWSRDPLDWTKAHRNPESADELKRVAARLCVLLNRRAEVANTSRAKDLDQSTRSWASGQESAFLEACDLLFRSFQLSDEDVRAAEKDQT
jgi:hypothetical protein